MKHVRLVSRAPAVGQLSAIEQLIITLFTFYFSDWDNFPVVIQNLQKYFTKTPTD